VRREARSIVSRSLEQQARIAQQGTLTSLAQLEFCELSSLPSELGRKKFLMLHSQVNG